MAQVRKIYSRTSNGANGDKERKICAEVIIEGNNAGAEENLADVRTRKGI